MAWTVLKVWSIKEHLDVITDDDLDIRDHVKAVTISVFDIFKTKTSNQDPERLIQASVVLLPLFLCFFHFCNFE